MSENVIKELRTMVLEDGMIKRFIIDNKITEEIFEKDLARFINQYHNNQKCNNCPGLHSCTMDVHGNSSRLNFYNGIVNLVYYPCKYSSSQPENSLEMLFFPKNDHLLNKEIDFANPHRTLALKEISRFLSHYQKEPYTKGIYLHGDYGTGKTQLLLHLANNLIKQNVEVLFVYYPDLVRNLKSMIGSSSFETLIERLKMVDVLMLDDIGAEHNTDFVRDEILGPILQYRMMAYLPVFMTSNYSLDILREHFSQGREEINVVKGDRIIERVRAMMEIVELKGKKYRL